MWWPISYGPAHHQNYVSLSPSENSTSGTDYLYKITSKIYPIKKSKKYDFLSSANKEIVKLPRDIVYTKSSILPYEEVVREQYACPEILLSWLIIPRVSIPKVIGNPYRWCITYVTYHIAILAISILRSRSSTYTNITLVILHCISIGWFQTLNPKRTKVQKL